MCVCERGLSSRFECESKYRGPACGREPWGYPSCVQPRRAMIRSVYVSNVVADACMCVRVRVWSLSRFVWETKFTGPACGREPRGFRVRKQNRNSLFNLVTFCWQIFILEVYQICSSTFCTGMLMMTSSSTTHNMLIHSIIICMTSYT